MNIIIIDIYNEPLIWPGLILGTREYGSSAAAYVRTQKFALFRFALALENALVGYFN